MGLGLFAVGGLTFLIVLMVALLTLTSQDWFRLNRRFEMKKTKPLIRYNPVMDALRKCIKLAVVNGADIKSIELVLDENIMRGLRFEFRGYSGRVCSVDGVPVVLRKNIWGFYIRKKR
jgi:hypothetical protein